MKRAASALVLVATLSLLAILFAARPFDRVNALLDLAFGAPPAWTQIQEHRFHDSRFQLSGEQGEAIDNYRVLADYWSAHPQARRIVFIGNSQMMTETLADGEPPPTGSEKTWVDHLSTTYRPPDHPALLYRLSNVGMSYVEALWHLTFLLQTPEIKPGLLVVQCNYQAFALTDIREEINHMLKEPRFRAGIQAIAAEGAPYSGAFAEALTRFKNQETLSAGSTQNAEAATPGDRIEKSTREFLNKIPAFAGRDAQKVDFMEMMFRLRVYLLQIKSTTSRSIGGVRLARSRAALERIAELCRKNNIRLALFHAPVNPAVKLYATEADRHSYTAFVSSLASKYNLPLYDFEHAIPAVEWGRYLNGPDPLHMGRQAHLRMAQLMAAELHADLNGR